MKTMQNETQLDQQEEINTWALLELFGHTKIAGRVSTRKLGSEVMFQVDVPKGETEFAYSRLFNPKAVFSVNPTTEAWCRKWADYAATTGHQVLPYIPDSVRQIEDFREHEEHEDEDEDEDEDFA